MAGDSAYGDVFDAVQYALFVENKAISDVVV